MTEDDELLKQLSSLAQLPTHEVRRLLAALERNGFLLRRGRLVRISPDVLADHLLYRAAVDNLGKPTGFVDQMVTSFRPSLENILANAAELDWRSETTDGPESVLRTAWRELFQLLPESSNRQRAELVGQLKRASIFAPIEVLRILEWFAEHPDAPRDELLAEWGLEDSPDQLIDVLTEVTSLIATDPDLTKRCAALLWALASRDERGPNAAPSHPRRRLADLVKYEPRTGWKSPDGVQVKAIEFLVGRLRTKPRAGSATWAVSALAGALRRTGEATESDRRTLTLREFSLATFAPHLAQRRDAVIQCLVDIALDDRLDEAATALSELGSLLTPPRGPFGRGLEANEVAVWQSETERAISLLRRVSEAATSEVIRFLARRELRATRQDYWPQIAPTVRAALEGAAAVPGEPLYDLLIGLPWEEQLDDRTAEDTRIEGLCRAAAQVFWREHVSASGVVNALLTAISAFEGLVRNTDSHTGRLVHALVSVSPDDPREFIEHLAGREPVRFLLRPALLALHEKAPVPAETLSRKLALSEDETVRASVLEAVQWMIDRAADLPTLVELTRTLSQDPSPSVRAVSARVLGRLAKHGQSEALAILTTIDWAGLLWLGEVVLGALDATHGLDPSRLSDDELDVLLERIEQLHTLEGRNYEVLEFIGFASKRRPARTVEMLLRRVTAVDEHSKDQHGERWLPMPYNGHGLGLPGVHAAANHPELVRMVRDASVGATSSAAFWLPILFRLADPTLVAARTVLREWLALGDRSKIVAAATLLRGFDHSVVFAEHELVAEILVAAERCDAECLTDASGALFALAGSGAYSGIPGEPAPRHVQDKLAAQRLSETYATSESVRDFYRALVASAEHHIRLDIALWDEDGEGE